MSLRTNVALLRELAEQIRLIAAEVATFHRPDVWTGQVAEDFGRGLERQQSRLVGSWGITEQILWQAHLAEQRAAAIEVSLTFDQPS